MKAMIETLSRVLPDRLYLDLLYFKHFRKFPNWKKPRSFNEKLQWLKLYDRNPFYSELVDKYLVKNYVESKIGKEYVIPTLGHWDDPSEIDFDSLPDKFVLKWNHDSGSIVICKDRLRFDKQKACKELASGKSGNKGFWYGREWPYKNVKPVLIAEPYLEDSKTKELRDYKFFTFGGKVEFFLVASDRQNPDEDTKFDFFDNNLCHMNMVNVHPNARICPEPPQNYKLMKELAEKLAVGFKHLRVDFYEVDGHVYFGELTLFHGSGLMTFEPNEWYYKLGDLLKL